MSMRAFGDNICERCKNKNKTHCSKCGEQGVLTCDTENFSHLECKKCQRIYFSIFCPDCLNVSYSDEWAYIYYDGIKENGLEWYKKARNKLIKKIEFYETQQKREKKLRQKKLINKISKWK